MHVALPKTRTGEKLPPSEQRLGFMAAGNHPSLGYVGGYLLTTSRGRPLEFHYTTPVKPTATHRILYGAELEPYILGELIAANLATQSTIEAAFILTDQPHLLNQRKNASAPILYVAGRQTGPKPETKAESPTLPKAESEQGERPAWDLRCHADHPDDVAALERWLHEVNPGLDLKEPFVRVWEALHEVLGAEPKSQAA